MTLSAQHDPGEKRVICLTKQESVSTKKEQLRYLGQ